MNRRILLDWHATGPPPEPEAAKTGPCPGVFYDDRIHECVLRLGHPGPHEFAPGLELVSDDTAEIPFTIESPWQRLKEFCRMAVRELAVILVVLSPFTGLLYFYKLHEANKVVAAMKIPRPYVPTAGSANIQIARHQIDRDVGTAFRVTDLHGPDYLQVFERVQSCSNCTTMDFDFPSDPEPGDYLLVVTDSDLSTIIVPDRWGLNRVNQSTLLFRVARPATAIWINYKKPANHQAIVTNYRLIGMSPAK